MKIIRSCHAPSFPVIQSRVTLSCHIIPRACCSLSRKTEAQLKENDKKHAAELTKLENNTKAWYRLKSDEKLKLQNKCDAEHKRSLTFASEMKEAQSEAKTATDALSKYRAEAANIIAMKDLEMQQFMDMARKDFDKQKAQACTTLEHEMEIRKKLLLTEKSNTKKARDSLALETQNLAAKSLELGMAMTQNQNLATSVVKLQDLFVAAVPGYFSINLIHFIVRDVDSVISVSLHSFQDKS